MLFEDVLPKLRNGRKAYGFLYPKGNYIYIDSDNRIMLFDALDRSEREIFLDGDDLVSREWELVPE